MCCLLDVVAFNVGDDPYVARILSKWIAGVFACIGTLEVFLAGVFLRNPNGIEIKVVAIRFSKPHDDFVSPGETFSTMKSVLKMPHDAIAHL